MFRRRTSERGRSIPRLSQSSSVNDARMASSGVPVRIGGSSTASATESGCRVAQSAKPRSDVQSTAKRSPVGASLASEAMLGPGEGRAASMTRRVDAPARTRRSIVSVGSIVPASIRETVDVGTPTLRANAPRDKPAPIRASRTNSDAAVMPVAYMQHFEVTSNHPHSDSVLVPSQQVAEAGGKGLVGGGETRGRRHAGSSPGWSGRGGRRRFGRRGLGRSRPWPTSGAGRGGWPISDRNQRLVINTESLDTQAGYRPADDELLDLLGAFEDVVDHCRTSRPCFVVSASPADQGLRVPLVPSVHPGSPSCRDE